VKLILTAADLGGFVALLLWGIHMVQTGINRAFGARLKSFLASTMPNQYKAFAAGLAVTAVLQSSTATGLIITGFIGAGLIDLVPALAAMLGANIGTTLIVQLLSFNVVAVAPILILAGFLLFKKTLAETRDFGRVLIGLGLLLLALHEFIVLIEPYENAHGLRVLLLSISSQPLLAVILAAIITWAAHSSVAVVLIVMSFATQGSVNLELALALVLGANLGTAINPIIEGTGGANLAAKRLPIGNLVNRVVGIAVALFILPYVTPAIERMEPNNARAVADFHTAFNIGQALVFFPFLTQFADQLRRWLPTRPTDSDPKLPRYLDPTAMQNPAVALANAARETLRMADQLEHMLVAFRTSLEKPSRRMIEVARRSDDKLDSLSSAIKTYLLNLDQHSLSEDERVSIEKMLTFAVNVEQAGDIVDQNLFGLSNKMIQRGLAFSTQGMNELCDMAGRLITNMQLASSLLIVGDVPIARKLAGEKQAFRQMAAKATRAHFERLRDGNDFSNATSAIHLDMLRDLKQVNSHIVAAAAYPVLEHHDELLVNRLRPRS